MKKISNLNLLTDEQLSNVVGGMEGDKKIEKRVKKDADNLFNIKKSFKNSSNDKIVEVVGVSAFGIAVFSTWVVNAIRSIKNAF